MTPTEATGTTDGPCEVTSADISPSFQPCRPPVIRVIAQARLGTWSIPEYLNPAPISPVFLFKKKGGGGGRGMQPRKETEEKKLALKD